jgi:tetratricopeptide (TPR) repeat protein
MRALLPEAERPDLQARILSLVRAQLIHPDRPEFAGEDAFRFAHALIRDAAYEGTPKSLRADVHEGLADWLETRPEALDEIVGHHLEQAYERRVELAPPGERERALGARAAERLAAAARTAAARGMLPASARLLERAVALLPEGAPARAALLPALGATLCEAGWLADAGHVLDEAIASAEAQGDAPLEARAQVEREIVRLQAEARRSVAEGRRAAGAALAVLEEHGDLYGQCRAWGLLARIDWTEGRCAAADEGWLRAGDLARRAGEEQERFETLSWRADAAVFGPMPVREGLERCAAIHREVAASPAAAAATLQSLAALRAMAGDVDQARELIREGNEVLGELGGLPSAAACFREALVEMYAGRPDTAERELRRGYERLDEMGERYLLATTAAQLARALHAQGRDGEADAYCEVSARAAAPEDVATHVIWQGVRARVLAGRGLDDDAERLARAAVELAEGTDMLVDRADALIDLAEVMDLGGRADEADRALAVAIDLLEQKGCLAAAERARSRRAGILATQQRSNGGH